MIICCIQDATNNFFVHMGAKWSSFNKNYCTHRKSIPYTLSMALTTARTFTAPSHRFIVNRTSTLVNFNHAVVVHHDWTFPPIETSSESISQKWQCHNDQNRIPENTQQHTHTHTNTHSHTCWISRLSSFTQCCLTKVCRNGKFWGPVLPSSSQTTSATYRRRDGEINGKSFLYMRYGGVQFSTEVGLKVEHSMRECVCDEPEGTSHGDEACNAAGLV